MNLSQSALYQAVMAGDNSADVDYFSGISIPLKLNDGNTYVLNVEMESNFLGVLHLSKITCKLCVSRRSISPSLGDGYLIISKWSYHLQASADCQRNLEKSIDRDKAYAFQLLKSFVDA